MNPKQPNNLVERYGAKSRRGSRGAFGKTMIIKTRCCRKAHVVVYYEHGSLPMESREE